MLTYRMGVVEHYTAALTTVATAAANRERLLRDFLEYRRSASATAADGAARVPPRARRRPVRAERARGAPRDAGHRGPRTDEPLAVGEAARCPQAPSSSPRRSPPGASCATCSSPHVHHARGVREGTGPPAPGAAAGPDLRRDGLEPAAPVRRRRGRPTMPPGRGATAPLRRRRSAAPSPGGPPGWRTWCPGASAPRPRLAREAPRRGEGPPGGGALHPGRPHATTSGTAVVRVAENRRGRHAKLAALAAQSPSVEVVPLDSALGGRGRVARQQRGRRPVKAPRVLLAWDEPASTLSAGWARYVLEHRFGLQSTAVRVSSLGRVD